VSQRDDVLVWVDLEMTGLEPDSCAIVQAALVLTDYEFNEIGRPIEMTIWQPESVLETMSPFVRAMHEKSGLLDQIRRSEIDLRDAELQLMEVLTSHVTFRKGKLAGNSIWQDRRFIHAFMPSLDSYLHYRMVDVSSIKDLAEAWYGVRYEKEKEGAHTALFDIRQSIEELKYLRTHMMRGP